MNRLGILLMQLINIKNLLLILSTILSISAVAEKNEDQHLTGEAITYNAGFRYSFDSRILSEQRELLIHLPESYKNSDKSYPVIYVLDGNGHFKHATSAITYLQSQNFMPETILIGITNKRGMRGRDLGNGSDNFWSYIKNEVVNLVDENYRTSVHKTIFGHSMAGAFVMQEFVENRTWFNSYIAASPGMEMSIVKDYKEYFSQGDNALKELQGRSFYFTMAGIAAEGNENVQIVTELETLLKQRAPKSFNWSYQYLPQHAHMTTPYATFYEGITNTFNDFQPPSISNYQEYIKQGGMKGIEKYYQKRATKYQTTAGVPDRFIRRLGGVLFDDNHKDEAIKLLITNTQNFPESIWAHNALARLYDQNEQPNKSVETFRRALDLAKQSKNVGAIGYLKGEVKRVEK
jgi:predicted alpha/beta superfamily hydrolase